MNLPRTLIEPPDAPRPPLTTELARAQPLDANLPRPTFRPGLRSLGQPLPDEVGDVQTPRPTYRPGLRTIASAFAKETAGGALVVSVKSFGEIFEAVFTHRQDWATNTKFEHRTNVKSFYRVFQPNMPVSELTLDNLRRWLQQLRGAEGHAALQSKTIKSRAIKVRSLLRLYFDELAADDGLRPDLSIFQRVIWNNPNKPMTDDQQRANPLTFETLQALFELALDKKLHTARIKPRQLWLMVFLAVHQGLRRDGLTSLAWENIERSPNGNWLMTVREKRTGRNPDRLKRPKKPRTIPVLRVVRDELAAWWEACGRPVSGSVWGFDVHDEAALRSATQVVARHLGALFVDLHERTGKKHTLHDLRATCFSEFQLRGVIDAVVKNFVGHAQAEGVSARYAGGHVERIRAAVADIDLRVPPESARSSAMSHRPESG